MAHSKYGQALEALIDITPENQDKRIMVPLTSSLYVPGQLSNIQTVLVEVGTGYFVEKQIPAARVFINVSNDNTTIDQPVNLKSLSQLPIGFIFSLVSLFVCFLVTCIQGKLEMIQGNLSK